MTFCGDLPFVPSGNGGVLNGVPSAYHWYTERYGVKWPVGYEVNISSQGDNFIQVDFDTPWCQPESDVIAELSRRFSCTLEHWYAEQGCDFCGWQLYVSTTDEKWFFRNLGGDFHASGLITLCLSSSNPARPYIWRFSIFRRFT